MFSYLGTGEGCAGMLEKGGYASKLISMAICLSTSWMLAAPDWLPIFPADLCHLSLACCKCTRFFFYPMPRGRGEGGFRWTLHTMQDIVWWAWFFTQSMRVHTCFYFSINKESYCTMIFASTVCFKIVPSPCSDIRGWLQRCRCTKCYTTILGSGCEHLSMRVGWFVYLLLKFYNAVLKKHQRMWTMQKMSIPKTYKSIWAA